MTTDDKAGGSNPPGVAGRIVTVQRVGRPRLARHGGWNTRIDNVEPVLRRFFTAIGRPGLDFLLPSIAHELVMMSFPPPSQKKMSKRQCQKELDRISTLSKELHDVVSGIHPAVMQAMGFDAHNWSAFLELRVELIKLMHLAKDGIPPEALPEHVRGARKNEGAARITLRLAEHFTGFSGKLPTIANNYGKLSGVFYELVRGVFQALEITDSAEYRAKEAIEAFKVSLTSGQINADAITMQARRVLRAHLQSEGSTAPMEEIPAKSTD